MKITLNYAAREDLKDTSLDNPDMEIFTDGSSFVRDGKCKAGYAVVTAEQVLEAKSLPQGTSAQLAELVALTRALELSKGQRMGLIIYVSLFLLTPKILSLPLDPQDNVFLSWAHSYATFHNLTAGSAELSPLHQWKASHGGHPHFKEKTFSKSVNTFDNNHMRCLFVI